MITAIIVRLFVEFSSELFGYIDLYSTLLTNTKIYKINYWLTGVVGAGEFCFGLTIWEYVDKSIPMFMFIEICIVTLGMYFGAFLLSHKKTIKNWLRKKKISKSMKQKWEERKTKIRGSDGTTKQTHESIQKPGTGNHKDTLHSKLLMPELWSETDEFGD